MRYLTGILFSLFTITAAAQTKYATVTGRVTDENDMPLNNVSVIILGKNTGIISSDSGTFSIKVPAQKILLLIL